MGEREQSVQNLYEIYQDARKAEERALKLICHECQRDPEFYRLMVLKFSSELTKGVAELLLNKKE